MFFNILKGMFIGAANVIPGVSGGTIAFICGVYSFLTESIGEYFTCTWEKRKKYTIFLIQIGIGVLLGIALFAKIIGYLYESHPQPTGFFFIGLIIASLPIILEENEGKIEKKSIAFLIFGFILILILGILNKMNPSELNGGDTVVINFAYSLKLYFCGTIAAGAMVVPGISGSLLLILLGEYYNVINFVNDRNLLALSIIAFGCITGILVIARAIDFLLKKHKNSTLFFILGLIIASIFTIWPGFNISLIIPNILSLLFGVALVIISKRFKKE